MLNKIRLTLLSGTLASVALTAFLVFAPTPASAQEEFEPVDGGGGDPTYSAGKLRSGTNICRCPELVGNCVCEIS
jgi:hypothetical protein